MDKTCAVLEALAGRIVRGGPPGIPYAGPAGGFFRNPDAPHIELAFVLAGECRRVRVGREGLLMDLPAHHLSIHNVHFGNHSRSYERVKILCLFLDIGPDAPLAWMGRRPFAHVFPVRNPGRLSDSFRRLRERCLAISGTGGAYPKGPYGFDPARDAASGAAERLLLQAALLELLGTAWQEVQRPRGGRAEPGTPLPVRLAQDFLAGRYADAGLRLEDVARAAHLSADHFGRLFRQTTGESPMSRLQAIRIEQACRLLDQPSLRIHEVAEHVGFPDPYHFSRVFRIRMGMSPRSYRETKAPARPRRFPFCR